MIQVLDDAKQIINGERQEQYGQPEYCFNTIASYWNEYIKSQRGGHEITAHDVAMMMILLKIARVQGVATYDTLVDIAGYAAIADHLT